MLDSMHDTVMKDPAIWQACKAVVFGFYLGFASWVGNIMAISSG